MKRTLLAILTWLLLAAAAAPPPQLSITAFRDRVTADLQAATGQETSAIDDMTFRSRTAGGLELTVNVENMYREYQADPTRLDAIVSRYVGVLAGTDESGAEPIEQLIVIVRPTGYLRASLPAGADMGNFAPPRPMAGDLSYFLAVDSPESIRTATIGDLARWGVNEEAAWARAVANIRPRVGPLELVRLGSADGALGLGAQSGIAPSVLADPNMCGPSESPAMRGQLVLLFSRDMFLLADPSDAAARDTFWRTTRQAIADGSSLSRTPLICSDGRWVEAPPP